MTVLIIDHPYSSPAPRTIWTYAYRILPPRSPDYLRKIKALISQGHSRASRRGRTWVGRIVFEKGITHIMVVSDDPQQDGEINHRLEAGFRALNMGFEITAPMIVGDDGAFAPDTPPRSEVLTA